MAIFDEVVHTKVMDGQVKLTRSLQYTTGPAKMAIKKCSLIGGDAGYIQARDILKNRYGNSHLVSQMIITDLKNGKRITKANELQQLADELSTALTALGQVCRIEYSIVPAMNGHPRDQAKVSVHDRWPHIGGTGGVNAKSTQKLPRRPSKKTKDNRTWVADQEPVNMKRLEP